MIYFLVIIMFIVIFITTVRITPVYEMQRAIIKPLTEIPFDFNGDIYNEIGTTTQVDKFISTLMIPTAYNETIKYYTKFNPREHFVQEFNYLMGCRMTYKKIALESISNNLITYRKENYKGSTAHRFHNLDKKPFGVNQVPYEDDGGYKGLGGHVFFFPDTYTIEEAASKYNQMTADGLYDNKFLALTIEFMFYNKNYDLGVIFVFEFLANNAGLVEKNYYTNSFYQSKYTSGYSQYKGIVKNLLIA